nr:PREDICTED: DNA-directed RNA polymerase, mitochondrial isoform X3 [Megachile rotundata]XP_012149175.1 PREDICTED: DNA-directed RNA polymerase, mitochondrial isoform X3 [Megachile rotundata]
MYKLSAMPFTKRIFSHGVYLVPKQIVVQHSMRLCTLCNFYHGKVSKHVKYYQIHTNTTTINISNHPSSKKKIKQKMKKYAELLTVTEKETSTKMAKVHKLNSADLSTFVDESNITTDKTCDISGTDINKVSNSEHRTKDYQAIDNNKICLNIENYEKILSDQEVQHHNEFSNDAELFGNLNKYDDVNSSIIHNDTLCDSSIPSYETMINKKLKKNLHLKVNKISQKKEHHKIKNKFIRPEYVESLLVHMQVYLSCGMLNRAKNTLMIYKRFVKNNMKHNDKCIELYNMLLEAYASRKNIVKVLDLYDMIKKDSLIPTTQTYVYVLSALGQEVINDERKALLGTLVSEMNNYNISFNDIFNKSYFKKNQRENVFKSVRALMPDFEPTYTLPSTEYSCKLLSKILTQSNYRSPVQDLLTMEELQSCLEMQLRNESVGEVQIKSVESCKDTNSSTSRKRLEEVENYWKDAVSKAFERNLKCLKQKECQFQNSLMVLHPFLEVLDKSVYINGILREVEKVARGSETYSMPLRFLYIDLGKYIYNKYEVQTKKQSGLFDKILSIYSKYLDWYLHPKEMEHLSNMNNRTIWQYLEMKEVNHGTSLNITMFSWSLDVLINIGKFLYNIILNDIILHPNMLKGQDLKCSIPAFYTLFRNRENYLSEQIKPHPLVSKLYRDSKTRILTFDSHILPSHAPPRPWTSIYSGGYLMTKIDFMRLPSVDSPWHKLQNTPGKQLFPIFDSLNQLSSIPWMVNTDILDIAIKIFQNGGSEKLNVPRPISVLSLPPSVKENATIQEKRSAVLALAQYKQKRYDMYSLWCDALYRLSIANHLRNKVFWLPHNLDFRGRVYPVPPHLNHLSSDLGRSFLLFANGKPLGPDGLNWLKLHVINLTNFKKGSSVQERLEYANQNMENILDSATKPLTGKMWWAEAEEPWQTLAGCMEIANALKTPNVEEYVSRFPVHQDGSCNGLQHYAALGRDQIGAESVNLYPFDVPNDVYTAVATIIEKQRQIDAKNDVKIAQLLEGFVKRKVIKQTVMTTVYGVTKYGAKHQIAKQLRNIEDFPYEYVWPASIYLAESTFNSLRTMFKSAREIQDWLTTCARIISILYGENVEWVTPLGLPIVQPYIKQKPHKIYVLHIYRVDSMKQKNAFAPNFIHSLDSCHMMLTSLYCSQENVTFVSVHDCFWTHPCTVTIMNKICREQFVALHSEPILENLSDYFLQRYKPLSMKSSKKKIIDVSDAYQCLLSVPSKGTFDINNVLKSVYFFN